MMMDTSGKVLLARLYQRTSASGNTYFNGRIGAAKVAMFLDKRAEGDDPVWELFVQDGDRPAERPPQMPKDARQGFGLPDLAPEPVHRTHARSDGRGDGNGTCPSVRQRPSQRGAVEWQAPLDFGPLNDPLPPDNAVGGSMTATPLPTDAERLAALAGWLDQAARWFEREVQDSRLHLAADPEEDIDPEHRVEEVTFVTAELNGMRDGLRCAADMLLVLAHPLPSPIASMTSTSITPPIRRSRGHLRVVE